MIPFIDNIATTIRSYVPQLERGIYLARIDDEGRILAQSQDNQNEFVYAGIKDNDGNYFYIRHRDSGEIFYNESTDYKRLVCNQTKLNARYSLRLVAVVRNWCPYNLEDNLRRALINVPLPDIDNRSTGVEYIRNGNISQTKSIIDSIAVLKEESPNKKKQFDKNLIFVAVDFDLTLEYNYF